MKLNDKEKTRLLNKYGEWAIVTGASSGIGFDIAKQLADSGFKLILNARREQKLEEATSHLLNKYNTEIESIAGDISDPDVQEKIIRFSSGKNLGLLVASAGYGTSGSFLNTSVHAETNMLRVNSEAVLTLSHHFSQVFSQQKRGGIILLSSLVAFQGVPFAANYAASKAYIQSLAEALYVELKPHGVDVLSAAPGPVNSGFGQRADMKMNTPLSADKIGAPILKALGRKSHVVPGFLSKFLTYSIKTAPRKLKVRIMKVIMGGFTRHQLPVQVASFQP